MAVDDRCCHVDEFAPVVLGVGAKHLECSFLIDAMAGHQDPFRLLDRGAAPERPLQVLVFGKALERDVDRTLQLFGVGVDEVRENAAFCSLVDVRGIPGREQRDHRAGGFVDDLRDQLERVLGAQAEANQRHIGSLPRSHRTDLPDLDLTGDHVMAELGDDLCEQLEPVTSLIRDQDTEVLGSVGHPDTQV